MLDGDALVAVLGLGSSLQVSGAAEEGQIITKDQAVILGSPLEPWRQAGHMAAYYAALVCTTYAVIRLKWPRRRVQVMGEE